MERFARLYEAIDRTTSTNEKVATMAAYFREAPPEDAAWALYFLSGQRLKRVLSAPLLAGWIGVAADLPDWLLRECYSAVGDFAETAALVLDQRARPDMDRTPLAAWVRERILPLRGMDRGEQRASVLAWLLGLPTTERMLLVKLLTGEFRAGVARTLVQRALAQAFGLPQDTIAHRLMGEWTPSPEFMRALADPAETGADATRPYPFFLASPIQDLAGQGPAGPDELGSVIDWQIEWKWDGIRAQLIRRQRQTVLWSRGEEVITDRFPEVAAAGAKLPDGTVIDGEILAWRGGPGGRTLGFAALQRRIGRITPDRRILSVAPVTMVAYDLLESGGIDIRSRPLRERRTALEVALLGLDRVFPSPILRPASWDEARGLRAASRERGVEGLMVKRLDSAYGVGRTKGDWWKWKSEPHTFDAVLVYAEPGHGKRANLLTDYTFAVWDGRALVPVAKAYSGLSNDEIAQVDRWIRQHTVERRGPVRVVEPALVFEIAFEGIAESQRHRSGIATRFPRIARWRHDKPPADADSLDRLRAMIRSEARGDQNPTLFE